MTEGSSSDASLARFEEFLVRHHESGEAIESLCAAHPEDAERFRRWWRALADHGEVESEVEAVDLLPGQRFGRYQLERELGRGAQAHVWLAEDLDLRRRVALKVMSGAVSDAGRASRFAREAELASRLQHPGLCTVYDRGVHRGRAYLAMRYIEGRTLGAYIAATDGVTVDLTSVSTSTNRQSSVLEIFAEIADAVHAAHEAGLVHRDIKPENILIGTDGQPVVLDFGLAREAESNPTLTRTGDVLGTPAYMSPEQVRGESQVDAGSDVWSLGASLFEALTGLRPFDGATRADVLRAILEERPPRLRTALPSATRDLEIIVETCLARRRADRYATAAALASDLRALVRGEPIAARPIGPAGRLWRWAQRQPVVAASLTAAVLALAAGTIISSRFAVDAWRAQEDSARAFERLADGARLSAATVAAQALHPIEPDDASALTSWLRDYGEPLRAALPEHRRALEELESRGRRLSVDELESDPALANARLEERRLERELDLMDEWLKKPQAGDRRILVQNVRDDIDGRIAAIQDARRARRVFAFDDPRDRSLHEAMLELVQSLEEFVADRGLFQRMRGHADWAESVDPAQPFPGFVSLGPDPNSGLEEFAFMRSGVVPRRDADGRLVIDTDSAIVFVAIPAARYLLGRPRFARDVSEKFTQPVQLDRYLIAKHEMSRAQWGRLTGGSVPNGGRAQVIFALEPYHPLESVSWEEAVAVLREFGLQLPTEAQWEYAASADRRTRYWWGDDQPGLGTIPDNLRDKSYRIAAAVRGVRGYDDGHAALAPVFADFDPNPFGLISVYGNVAEWCRECFMNRAGLNAFEPLPGDGFHRVPAMGSYAVRGGSFDSAPVTLHSGLRRGFRAGIGHPGVGVRPVKQITQR